MNVISGFKINKKNYKVFVFKYILSIKPDW